MNHCNSKVTSISTARRKIKLYSFNEARKIARSYGFKTQEEFVEYECAGVYHLPKNVNELYQAEWKGWNDFLGVPLPFEEARTVAVMLDNLDSKESYLKLKENESHLEGDDIILRLPYRPDKYYKDFISWNDFLGL